MSSHQGLLGPLTEVPSGSARRPERRILVINSNSSPRVTSIIATHLAGSIRTGSSVWFATAAAGPAGIDSALDMTIAAVETARLVARYRDSFDGFVIACGNDPGLVASRQVTDRPVVGIAEAGMLQACTLGATFAIPVFSPAKVALMRALVTQYGLAGRLADVFGVDTDPVGAINRPAEVLTALVAGARRARDRQLAEAVVLTGSVLCPHRAALQDAIGLPVVDGTTAALGLVENLIDQNARTSRRFSYHHPAAGLLRGYDDLTDLYEQETPMPAEPVMTR